MRCGRRLEALSFHDGNGLWSRMTSEETVAALAALAQENRLDVFRLLVRRGAEGVAAGDIADALAIAPATLSFHLNQLRHAASRKL
jgi:DNA-binding transcriptional ArsR family regulator